MTTEVAAHFSPMKISLWIVQVLLALVFVASASVKLFAFERYKSIAPEMADKHALTVFIGLCEYAGVAGLFLPVLTGIVPVLTTWAAVGLGTIMILATGLHLYRGELPKAVVTTVLLGLSIFLVYGRGFGGTAPM